MNSTVSILIVLTLACFSFQFEVALSEDWCPSRGFDPTNLSCDTCTLLEESTTLQSLQKEKNAAAGGVIYHIDIVAECRSCCQEWKVNPKLHPEESLRGKYRYALLTYTENSLDQHGEIKDFLERDKEDVLSFKGDNRFQAVKLENTRGGTELDSDLMMAMNLMGRVPPKLMFFEKQKQGGSWSEEDEKEAGEVINLRGWKREDLKDMLLTLLPNA